MSTTRAEIVARAASWVNRQLTYNQAGSHDGYRTDCSGYVSMCWGLSFSDDTTGFLPRGEVVRISKDELQQGDALLNDAAGNDGHIALFDSWADPQQSRYLGYEFTGSGVHYRPIPYPYFDGFGTFFPVRPTNLSDARRVDRRRLDEEVA